MAIQYNITIKLQPSTLQALLAGGFKLYFFQAFRGGGGRPLAWQVGNYVENTTISGPGAYLAYTSPQIGGPDVPISKVFDIQLGQTLQVTAPDGGAEVVPGGVAGAISILNRTTTEFTVGTVTGESALCAYPLHGGNLVVIEPLPLLFLEFSANGAQTPDGRSLAPGVLVSVEDAQDRTVEYDVNKGWSAGGAAWAQTHSPFTDLGPLLVYPLVAPHFVDGADAEDGAAPGAA